MAGCFIFFSKLQPIKSRKSIIAVSATYEAGTGFYGIRDESKNFLYKPKQEGLSST